MSRWMKLANAKGRWAQVRIEPHRRRSETIFVGPDGERVTSATFIKSTLDTGYESLRNRYGDAAAIAEALITGDPEIDIETAGHSAGRTDRVLLDPDFNVLYAASPREVIYDPDGTEIERREPVDIEANVNPDMPPVWSGHMMPRADAARGFAFTRNYQIRHVDGLTFDFLFDLAGHLERADAMAVVGSGLKGTGPLFLERNGVPYRGFLEGRTGGDKYLLILHLSNMELKRLADADGGEVFEI